MNDEISKSGLITDPSAVLAVLLATLAVLFWINRQSWGARFFRVVPLIIFAYFVPTFWTNVPWPEVIGGTPLLPKQSPTYDLIKEVVLPASLLLLTLAIDIPAILRLGRDVILLFLTATATIVLGGPLAYLLYMLALEPMLSWATGQLGLGISLALPADAWKGLAALSGSWIGGGANFVAVGKSVEISDALLGTMVVVDVAAANLWMAVLLYFAGRERKLDEAIGADRSRIDEVRTRVESYQQQTSRPTSLADLTAILALGIGGSVLANVLGPWIANHDQISNDIVSPFTWTVILVTTLGITGSFTPLRSLEGAGASAVGSTFLWILVATIGAGADFARVLEAPGLILIGLIWISFHALVLLLVRRWLRAPIFFAAVGSKANVGGAASAPVLAAAFHPALAPVGVLLAVAGYALGTYAALVCRELLRLASLWVMQ